MENTKPSQAKPSQAKSIQSKPSQANVRMQMFWWCETKFGYENKLCYIMINGPRQLWWESGKKQSGAKLAGTTQLYNIIYFHTPNLVSHHQNICILTLAWLGLAWIGLT